MYALVGLQVPVPITLKRAPQNIGNWATKKMLHRPYCRQHGHDEACGNDDDRLDVWELQLERELRE